MNMTLNEYIAHLQEVANINNNGELTVAFLQRGFTTMNELEVPKAVVLDEYSVGGNEGYFVEENVPLENLIGPRQMVYSSNKVIRKVVALNFELD